jgi:hypothetical protein
MEIMRLLAAEWEMFWKRRQTPRDVSVGRVFRHQMSGGAYETAEVVSIEDDYMGVRHVRYRSIHYRGNEITDVGVRLLGLESFRVRYQPDAERTGM